MKKYHQRELRPLIAPVLIRNKLIPFPSVSVYHHRAPGHPPLFHSPDRVQVAIGNCGSPLCLSQKILIKILRPKPFPLVVLMSGNPKQGASLVLGQRVNSGLLCMIFRDSPPKIRRRFRLVGVFPIIDQIHFRLLRYHPDRNRNLAKRDIRKIRRLASFFFQLILSDANLTNANHTRYFLGPPYRHSHRIGS